MASLKDTEQLTQQLEDLVGRMRSELQNGNVDFEKLISVADELSESADALAETFTSVNEALMERLQGAKSSGSRRSSSQSGSQSESKSGARS
jgi:hypothetical protein